jgi:hypothetical protein
VPKLIDSVDISLRGGHLGPPHDGHDGSDVDTLEEQQGGGSVSGIVQPGVTDSG